MSSTLFESPATAAAAADPAAAAAASEADTDADAPAAWRRALPKLVLLGLVLGVAGGLYASGVELDLDAIVARVEAAGVWGPLVFLAATATIPPAGLSMHPFLLTAGMVWDPVPAVLIAWTGTMASALSGFGFARYVARDWVQARAPERFRRYDAALAERGFRTVLLVRLVFFTTPWLQLIMGASRVRFRDYIAATAIGNLPTTVLVVVLGEQIARWLGA